MASVTSICPVIWVNFDAAKNRRFSKTLQMQSHDHCLSECSNRYLFGAKAISVNEEITQLIYKHDIIALRSQLTDYLKNKDELRILFDNIDKGWPPQGVSPQDVLTLRCLIDALFKLQRALHREDISANFTVFIRNDVFENLMEITPDRGKISTALVDWSDPELLLEILRRRFLVSGIHPETPFDNIWRTICVSHIGGEETSHYLVDRCLMRPRSFIEFLGFCRSHAVGYAQ